MGIDYPLHRNFDEMDILTLKKQRYFSMNDSGPRLGNYWGWLTATDVLS
jgi:hypothetical protein